jgi:hypothetical protein
LVAVEDTATKVKVNTPQKGWFHVEITWVSKTYTLVVMSAIAVIGVKSHLSMYFTKKITSGLPFDYLIVTE